LASCWSFFLWATDCAAICLMFKCTVKVYWCMLYDRLRMSQALLLTYCVYLQTAGHALLTSPTSWYVNWTFKILKHSVATYETWIPFTGLSSDDDVTTKAFFVCLKSWFLMVKAKLDINYLFLVACHFTGLQWSQNTVITSTLKYQLHIILLQQHSPHLFTIYLTYQYLAARSYTSCQSWNCLFACHVSSNFVNRNLFLIVWWIIQCNMINPPCPYSAEHFGVRYTHWSLVSNQFLTQILEIEGLCSYSQISDTSCMHVRDIISLDLLWETQEYVFISYVACYDLSHIAWTQKSYVFSIEILAVGVCLICWTFIKIWIKDWPIVRADKVIHEHTITISTFRLTWFTQSVVTNSTFSQGYRGEL